MTSSWLSAREDSDELASTRQGNITVVRPGHELDSTSAPETADYFEAQIKNGHVRLVLDLSAVTYLSSAGLRVQRVGQARTPDNYYDFRLPNQKN